MVDPIKNNLNNHGVNDYSVAGCPSDMVRIDKQQGGFLRLSIEDPEGRNSICEIMARLPISDCCRGLLMIFVFICLVADGGCSGSVSDNDGNGNSDVIASNNEDRDAGTVGEFANPVGSSASTVTYQQNNDEIVACVSISREPQQVEVEIPVEVEVPVVIENPVSLFVMLDQSRSMDDESDFSTKWEVAVDSINTFVTDPTSADLDIALQYFPLSNGECNGTGYSTPEVSMGQLPVHAEYITDSLTMHNPGGQRSRRDGGGGGTPLEGALNGVTAYCANYKQDRSVNPEGKNCVAVLVTDGLPNGCSEDEAVLVGIAADAYSNNDVMTFAIGMTGADLDLLDQIAEAGRGDCTPDDSDATWACNVSTGELTFLDALNMIRDNVTELQTVIQVKTELQTQTLECEWEIPDPPEGETFDRNQVNVEFTSTGSDADKQIIVRFDSHDKCGANLGWYYDDPDNPTRIIACEQACSKMQTSEMGKVNILLGCSTIVP